LNGPPSDQQRLQHDHALAGRSSLFPPGRAHYQLLVFDRDGHSWSASNSWALG